MDDRAMCARLAAGDQSALAQLYSQYRRAVYARVILLLSFESARCLRMSHPFLVPRAHHDSSKKMENAALKSPA